jgi:hypothetical protein
MVTAYGPYGSLGDRHTHPRRAHSLAIARGFQGRGHARLELWRIELQRRTETDSDTLTPPKAVYLGIRVGVFGAPRHHWRHLDLSRRTKSACVSGSPESEPGPCSASKRG